jgi:drug/metabolite transporter (DMT)-like permease
MSPILEFNAKKRQHVDDDSKENDMVDYLSLPEPISGKPKEQDDFASTKLNNGLLDPEAFRSVTASPYSETGGRLSPFSIRPSSPIPYSTTPQAWKSRSLTPSLSFWRRNRGVILVAVAQLFGAFMNLCARLLELDGEGMNPFQILFARMSLTTLFSCIYAYRTHVPDFPLGPRNREVRWLLVVRGFSGFFGIFGMWYSMMYLPLAEATVITFLAPCVAGYICHVLLHDPYTRKQQLASLLALVGVVFIARPTSLFPSGDGSGATAAITGVEMVNNATHGEHHPQTAEEATPAQRLMAIGVALLGVMGAAGAFTTIRWIGDRAHALVSVNYFSVWSMIVSVVVLSLAPVLGIGQPELHFMLPASTKQWFLLVALGVAGFVMQVMFTIGIACENANRAAAMVYTHMLFAAGFDRFVFGHEMGVLSLIGCGLIIGSALWALLTKKEEVKRVRDDSEVGNIGEMEGIPLLSSGGDVEDEETIALEHVR